MAPTASSSAKVVIIVGPTEGATSSYRAYADAEYAEVIKHTSNVVKVYSPNATWAAVQAAVEGASIVIYHGHGNGWPSPYTYDHTFSTKNGFGLNGTAGNGDYNLTYYGEPYVSTLHFAANAVVLLHNLCYASGNSEPGYAEPTLDVARQRVDNFAAGFLKAGAKAVIADGHAGAIGYLERLFTVDETLVSNWRNHADFHDNELSYNSIRTPGGVYAMDPEQPTSGYYRAISGGLNTRSTDIVGGAGTPPPAPTPTWSPGCEGVNVRTSPSTSATIKTKLGISAVLTVSGTVAGSSWSATCPTSKSGSSWYAITSINGTSVSALYGVGVLYAATGVVIQNSPSIPTPTPTPTPNPTPEPAPSTTTGTPACSSINLRSSTSTSSTIKGAAVTGTTLTIDATLSGSAWSAACPTSKSGSSWYRIVAVNGQSVASRYGVSFVYAAKGVVNITSSGSTPPPSTPPPSTASLYKPGCDGLNLRTSASTSGTVKTKAYLGTQLTVGGSVSGGSWSAVCPTSKSGSGWYKVTAINGSSVSSLYGVSVLYAATGVLVLIQ